MSTASTPPQLSPGLSSTKLSLYSLIIRQLEDDGFSSAASLLSSQTTAPPDASIPQNALLNALQAKSIPFEVTAASKKRKVPESDDSAPVSSAPVQLFSLPIPHIPSVSSVPLSTPMSLTASPAPASHFPPYATIFNYTHKEGVKCAAFSHDGSLLGSAGADATIKLVDCRALAASEGDSNANSETLGKQIIRGLSDHSDTITCLSFHPYDSYFVSCSKDHSVRIWNYSQSHHRKPLRALEFDFYPTNALFHPSGEHLLMTLSESNYPLLMDLSSFCTFVSRDHTENGHKGRLTCCNWNERGSIFLTGSKDGLVKVWDGTQLLVSQTIVPHGGQQINSCVFSPNGFYFLTSGKDSTVRLWDVRNYKQVQQYTGFVHQRDTIPAVFDPSGDYVLTSDESSSQIFAFDVKTGEIVKRLPGHLKPPRSIAITDGTEGEKGFVTAGEDGRVRVWAIKDN
jgi:cleavage stimulation factor subunit 1